LDRGGAASEDEQTIVSEVKSQIDQDIDTVVTNALG
jgi:hypothetical protein